MTWDDLDLYYGHKAQEMILTDVSDTIHADSLALFALNIEILLADVTKPEKSKILTLTWPVTSSVTSGSNFWPCMGSSRTGLSNGVWNLEIGPVVWEISGGALWAPPPPEGRVTIQTPAGRGLSQWRTRARADGVPSVAVCWNFNTMTGPGQPTWVPNFVRLVPAVVELLAFSNHDTRTDGRTDGRTYERTQRN